MDSAVTLLEPALRFGSFYLVLALVCSVVTECIAGVLDSRGRTLQNGISALLQDQGLKERLYAHPLIRGIQEPESGRLPSYIASSTFALALIDILSGSAATDDRQALRAGVENLEHPAAKTALTAVLQNQQFASDQKRIEAWFEQDMDRVSGWYKRTSQIRIFVLTVLLTLITNLDSFKLLRDFEAGSIKSAILLASVTARLQATLGAQGHGTTTPDRDLVPPDRDPITPEEAQFLPGGYTGWQHDWITDWPHHEGAGFGSRLGYLLKNRLGGWLITIMVASIGAPFWFDTLSRFMNVRNSGKPPDNSSDKVSA